MLGDKHYFFFTNNLSVEEQCFKQQTSKLATWNNKLRVSLGDLICDEAFTPYTSLPNFIVFFCFFL